MSKSKGKRSRRYSPEQKEHAVRLVRLRRAETGESFGSVSAVGEQLGFGIESVRKWVHDADFAEGLVAGKNGAAPAGEARIRELEQEVKELRRVNGVLRTSASFFAAELDRPHR
jgi:transposase